jgi:hypothetical protein
MNGVVAGALDQLAYEGREILVKKKPQALVRSGSSRSETASAA